MSTNWGEALSGIAQGINNYRQGMALNAQQEQTKKEQFFDNRKSSYNWFFNNLDTENQQRALEYGWNKDMDDKAFYSLIAKTPELRNLKTLTMQKDEEAKADANKKFALDNNRYVASQYTPDVQTEIYRFQTENNIPTFQEAIPLWASQKKVIDQSSTAQPVTTQLSPMSYNGRSVNNQAPTVNTGSYFDTPKTEYINNLQTNTGFRNQITDKNNDIKNRIGEDRLGLEKIRLDDRISMGLLKYAGKVRITPEFVKMKYPDLTNEQAILHANTLNALSPQEKAKLALTVMKTKYTEQQIEQSRAGISNDIRRINNAYSVALRRINAQGKGKSNTSSARKGITATAFANLVGRNIINSKSAENKADYIDSLIKSGIDEDGNTLTSGKLSLYKLMKDKYHKDSQAQIDNTQGYITSQDGITTFDPRKVPGAPIINIYGTSTNSTTSSNGGTAFANKKTIDEAVRIANRSGAKSIGSAIDSVRKAHPAWTRKAITNALVSNNWKPKSSNNSVKKPIAKSKSGNVIKVNGKTITFQ